MRNEGAFHRLLCGFFRETQNVEKKLDYFYQYSERSKIVLAHLSEEEIDCMVTLLPTFASSGHPVPMYTWVLLSLLYYISLSHRDREGIFESYGSEEHLDADEEVLVACRHGSRLKW